MITPSTAGALTPSIPVTYCLDCMKFTPNLKIPYVIIILILLTKGTDINKFFTESVCDLRETYRCYSTKAHSPGRAKSN